MGQMNSLEIQIEGTHESIAFLITSLCLLCFSSFSFPSSFSSGPPCPSRVSCASSPSASPSHRRLYRPRAPACRCPCACSSSTSFSFLSEPALKCDTAPEAGLEMKFKNNHDLFHVSHIKHQAPYSGAMENKL